MSIGVDSGVGHAGSSAATNNLGGWVSAGGTHHSIHTQDFILYEIENDEVPTGNSAVTYTLAFDLDELNEAVIGKIPIWQMYRVNSFEMTFSLITWWLENSSGVRYWPQQKNSGFAVYTVPWNRDALNSSQKAGHANLTNLVDANCKFFMAPHIQSIPDGFSATDAGINNITVPQVIRVSCPNPMYEIQLSTVAGAHSGATYSDAKLQIIGQRGNDATVWKYGLLEILQNPLANYNTFYTWGILKKVNITFEGTRWANESYSTNPLGHYRLAREVRSDRARKVSQRDEEDEEVRGLC